MTDVKLLLHRNTWNYFTVVCPCGVMAKALDCGIVVSKFEVQSRSYVHFRTNTLGKGTNPLILPAMSQIAPLQFF